MATSRDSLTLENGNEIFPTMLQAVKGARHNIHFEAFIYWSGDIGRFACGWRRDLRIPADHVSLQAADRGSCHGVMVSVGSTNFDNRSFRLNDEANLNVYDVEVVARVSAVFEGDLKRSQCITYQAWKDRPRREKLLEHLATFLSSQP